MELPETDFCPDNGGIVKSIACLELRGNVIHEGESI
jgi:hypothetical protein